MGLARKAAKAAVLPAGMVTRRRAGDVAMLLYHRLGDAASEIELPVHVFEQHVARLAAHDRPLTLEHALEGQDGGVVVTVDDGFRDFYEHALPLLLRYRVPAVLYLATGLVANGHGSPQDSLRWEDLREIVASGLVTIGSHTHSHIDLARATEREAEEEMRRSKELIEDRLGVACRHFAYPFAVASPPAERAARRIFDSAALAWSTNRAGRLDRYRLGRLPILRSDGPWLFRAKTAGLLDAEAYLYRVFRRGPWRPAGSR